MKVASGSKRNQHVFASFIDRSTEESFSLFKEIIECELNLDNNPSNSYAIALPDLTKCLEADVIRKEFMR